MKSVTFAAAAIAFGALMSIPAQAEHIAGAPLKNGNQCFNYSAGQAREGRFGSWGACAKPAALALAPTSPRRANRRSR